MMFGLLVAAGRLGASCPGRWPAWSLQGSGSDSGNNDGDDDGGWNCWSCWIMLIVVTWLRVYLQSTAWVLIKGTRLCTALGFVKISILLCEISCGFVKFEWKLDPVYSAWLTKSVTWSLPETRLTYNCAHLRLNNKKNRNKLSQKGPRDWALILEKSDLTNFLAILDYFPKKLFGWIF